MDIEYSGYREKTGTFCFQIKVDENRKDYEIHMKDGTVMKQDGPFSTVTRDWNCDGDIYPLFGAYFSYDGRGEFITPVDMVRFVVDGEANIPGIANPFEQPALDDQIRDADSRTQPASSKNEPNSRYR